MKPTDMRQCVNLAKGLGSSAKLVLLILATRVPEFGDECWPGNESLAELAEMSERNVKRMIGELKNAGVISIRMAPKEGRRYITINTPSESIGSEQTTESDTQEVTNRVGEGDNLGPPPLLRERKAEKTRERKAHSSFNSLNKDTVKAGSKDSQTSQLNVLSQTPSRSAPPPRSANSVAAKKPVISQVWPEIDELGKKPEDWEALFNSLMKIQGRPEIKWGRSTTPEPFVKAFGFLRSSMIQEKWWPTEVDLKAVDWRYGFSREFPNEGCRGGHRLKADPFFFLKEFYQVATECVTERIAVEGPLEAWSLSKEEVALKFEFLRKDISEWTDEEIRFAWNAGRVDPILVEEEIKKRAVENLKQEGFLHLPITEWSEDQIKDAACYDQIPKESARNELNRRHQLFIAAANVKRLEAERDHLAQNEAIRIKAEEELRAKEEAFLQKPILEWTSQEGRKAVKWGKITNEEWVAALEARFKSAKPANGALAEQGATNEVMPSPRPLPGPPAA